MTENIFINCVIFILPQGILKKRMELFTEKILKFGGVVAKQPHSLTTHIIVEDNLLTNPAQFINALKAVNVSLSSLNCKIVGTFWLSRSLKEKKLLSTENFEFKTTALLGIELKEENHESPCKKPRMQLSVDISFPNQNGVTSLHKKSRIQSSVNIPIQNGTIINHINDDYCFNKNIIKELQKLVDIYRARRDQWRALGYEKAIQSIKFYNKEIVSADEIKHLPHISSKMVDKISEILENGFLSKAEMLYKDEKTRILDTFGKIWGVGPTTAELWYQQGCKTLDDLELKGNLTHSQKIGLKYYHDIQEKIPRAEVAEIIDVVKNAALKIEPSLHVLPCGSYRRGKKNCGDVDVLIIKKDHIKYNCILPKILNFLKFINFIVDDLLNLENNDTPKKYLGLCKLSYENSKNRRLDIFVVPECESAAAIMHYTGSALFNRTMRTYAFKKNLHLSEQGLYRIFQDKEISGKNLIFTPNEETIFQYLGLPYRPPEEREMFAMLPIIL